MKRPVARGSYLSLRSGSLRPTCGGDWLAGSPSSHQRLGTEKRMFCNFWLELPEAEQEMSSGTWNSRSNLGSSWKPLATTVWHLNRFPSPSPFPSNPPPNPFSPLTLSVILSCTEHTFLWVNLASERSPCERLSHVTKFSFRNKYESRASSLTLLLGTFFFFLIDFFFP